MSKDAEKLVEEFSEDLALILETFIEETQDAKVVIARIETEMGRLKKPPRKRNFVGSSFLRRFPAF